MERVDKYLFANLNLKNNDVDLKRITGTDHFAGLGECERLLSESNGFLFYGTERILSYLNSSKISSFNIGYYVLLYILYFNFLKK